jgi:very-short-patch-repair endonuclease
MKNEASKSKIPMYYNASMLIQERATELRGKSTTAESLLWSKLKNRQLAGLKFRRQHPISQFIADFYCHEIKLVIEVDGSIHENIDYKERDLNKTAELERNEIKVLRFKNEEIINNIDEVLRSIESSL